MSITMMRYECDVATTKMEVCGITLLLVGFLKQMTYTEKKQGLDITIILNKEAQIRQRSNDG